MCRNSTFVLQWNTQVCMRHAQAGMLSLVGTRDGRRRPTKGRGGGSCRRQITWNIASFPQLEGMRRRLCDKRRLVPSTLSREIENRRPGNAASSLATR